MKVSYHPAKFVGRSYSGSGYIMFLDCHVISQNHMINRSCDLMGRSPSF